MTWETRLQTAAYTSPGGARIEFDYENVSKSFDKKTSAFNFPDANGTYVQDLGYSGRRYPLRVIFWGDTHDIQAREFETALQETGEGQLDHPAYGSITVVPFGTITQRDDLKTSANQSIIDVTFWETIGLVYPSPQTDPASNVLSSLNEYNDAAAAEFNSLTSLQTTVEQSVFLNNYNAVLNQVKLGLQVVADTQDDVKKQFDNIFNSINTGIDVLVSEPLNLAFQTILLVQSPGRAVSNIEARLSAYGDLAGAIISGSGVAVQGLDSTNSNTFHTNDLYSSTLLTGSILSVVNNTFFSKPEALSAAESILDQLSSKMKFPF